VKVRRREIVAHRADGRRQCVTIHLRKRQIQGLWELESPVGRWEFSSERAKQTVSSH